MSTVQDYQSSLSDESSRKMGTFSYLTEMTPERLRAQVAYIVSKGWDPGIEHTEPENAKDYYWYMWKLPLFGETDVDAILAEINACREAHPANHVRLIGYDNYKQTQGTSMVVHRGKAQ